MGILSNSVTLCRYRLASDAPKNPEPMLRGQAFRELGGAEERGFGWVGFGDVLALGLPAPAQVGEFLRFSMRIDSRKIPPALLRIDAIRSRRTIAAAIVRANYSACSAEIPARRRAADMPCSTAELTDAVA